MIDERKFEELSERMREEINRQFNDFADDSTKFEDVVKEVAEEEGLTEDQLIETMMQLEELGIQKVKTATKKKKDKSKTKAKRKQAKKSKQRNR